MLRLGLTCGLASGKSAVAAMLRELGIAVLDADALAHKLIEPGQAAYAEVIQEFGPSIADTSGCIDRAKFGAMVFADLAKLDRLNAIVHPRVAEVILSQFEVWRRSGVRDAVFVEAALLVESGIHKKLDGLVVVWCRPEQQLERGGVRVAARVCTRRPPDHRASCGFRIRRAAPLRRKPRRGLRCAARPRIG